MSTNQLQSFAVTDASTQTLKALWHDPEIDKSIFYPSLRGTSPHTLPFFRRVTPMTNAAFGQTAQYNLDNVGDFVEEMVLELFLSQIVPTVAGGAVSYKNDITCACIDTIRFFQGGTLLQQINNDQLLFQNRCFQRYSYYNAKIEAEGVLPLATRQARAAAGIQVFYIQIPSFLDTLAAPLGILTSSIRVEITFKNVLNAVQIAPAGTFTASILSANLRLKYINCSPDIVDALLETSKVRSVLFPFYDFVTTRQDFAAGTASFRFLLSEFKSITSVMGFVIREQQQVDDQTGNPAFEISNSVGFLDYNMTDRSINIISNPDNILPDQAKLIEQAEIFETFVDSAQRNSVDWFFIPHTFSLHPFTTEDTHIREIVATGSYDFSRTQSAFLIANGVATPNAYRVTGYGYFFNVLILRNGALTKYTV